MSRSQSNPAIGAAAGALLLLVALYFSFPMWIVLPFWELYQSRHLSYDSYLRSRNAILYPVDRLADKFPAYERWAFGPAGRVG
jgi:hypothetical protein